MRKIKDEHRIMSQATNKELDLSFQQQPITSMFQAPQISLH